MANGKFDMSVWKKGLYYQDKRRYEPPYDLEVSKATIEDDKPLSKDWQYYKKVKEDPEFDKEQGKTSTPRIFWSVIIISYQWTMIIKILYEGNCHVSDCFRYAD